MRVIAGKARGVPLVTIKERTTRPTIDRVKENLFNILSFHVHDAIVCDFFAGSGSLCIEALSRGAKEAYLFEKNRKAIACIHKNLEKTKLEGAKIIEGDYKKGVRYLIDHNIKPDIIFLDPPHYSAFGEESIKIINTFDILNKNGIIVVEHNTKEEYLDVYGAFCRFKKKKYGNTTISLYREIE